MAPDAITAPDVLPDQQQPPVSGDANAARAAAVRLARSGALLGPTELGLIFGIGYSAVNRNAKLGKYDVFKVNPALGPRCYSGTLVTRYLDGDVLYEPSFGRKRKHA